MTHLTEGAVVALRDAQPVDADAVLHLERCASCGEALEAAREREALLEQALGRLDESLDLERARAEVRTRLERGPWRAQPRAPRFWTRDLRRAAAILLLTAGAVSALPGSPIRQWLAGSPEAIPAVAAPEAQLFAEREAGAVAVPVPAEGLRVLIVGAAPGTQVEVVWVDAETARVVASSGSGFTYGEGRLEAAVTEGPVHIELPRGTSALSLMVEGAVYLTRSSAGLTVSGPVRQRSDERIVFAVEAP